MESILINVIIYLGVYIHWIFHEFNVVFKFQLSYVYMHDCIIVCKKKPPKNGVTMDASLINNDYEVVFLFVGKAKEVNVTIKT